MKKENAYTLMEQLLALEYDLDSLACLSAMLLRALQERPSDPAGYLLNCHMIWIKDMRRKLRNSLNLLDEAILQ